MPSSSSRSDVLQSERALRFLIDAIQDYAVFLLTPDGNVASWNPGAERIKGYMAAEIVGQHFSRFYLPEAIAEGKPARALKVAAETGRYEDEGWRVRKDGTKFWASVVVTRIRDEHGQLIGFGKITRDLTERRQAEQQYRRLIEGVTDYAIYSLDLEGRVTSWNLGAERMKGYKADEILGEHFSKFYVQEDLKSDLPSRLLEIAAREGHYEGEGWRVRKDGSKFWSHVVLTPIRDEEGVLVGFSKITRDITDRKALLDAIQEHSRELEQTNAELEAFSYSVSHDLRAPLRAIDGYSNILLEEFGNELPSGAKPYFQEILASTARMNQLVHDLLSYSRLSKLGPPGEVVSVKAVIMDAYGQIDPDLRSKVAVSVEEDMSVKAHRAVIRQAIVNLISNALKFTKPGMQPKVEVKAVRRGDLVHIEIKDEGIGIAPQHQERVFQMFERLHNADEYPGTGIGLAIVKRGITRMGGNVILRSEVGKGSTFEVQLPAA